MPEKFEVVISGVSGRFPECDDVETFKQMLYSQENPITYDNRKWPVNYKYKFGDEIVPLGTGKYLDIQKFDARVFACSAALAKCTDIINRKVLEPSFEAVMDAGINPTTLMGANVGCFMSSCINEVESVKIFTRIVGKFFIVGGSKAMCSNRVSFALNLTGPSFTFGGGVYGGLEALAAAYQNIAEGRIDAAIVGGSSSVIDPKLSVNFLRLGYLSPDGLTRSFDADANGYGRSEGAVVLFLQRAQDAKRSYGTVKLSDSFYYGMNPYTFIGFNEDTIETCLKKIYENNQHNVRPSEVSFLEMDACGVKFREKQEVDAVERIFCNGRSDSLLVGSVKSYSGHTEGAAPYISVLKCLFALDSGYIAPNMHFIKPNPELKQLENGKLKVVAQKTKLPGRMVGVNALSFFGVTSHAVFEQHSKWAKVEEGNENDNLPRLLILCGRTEMDLKKVIDKVEAMPLNKEFVYISNDVFKTPMTTHFFRGYTIIPPSPQPTNAVEVCEGENRPIWFIFSGMGSQWNGMGKALLSIPIFAEAINRCDAVLRPKGIDIHKIITSDDPTMFDNIVHAFVGIISVQVGLVNILRALGIEPDGIIGHSVGENACAYADGCLSLEQAVLASYARGIASNEAETIKGMMAAIGRGYHQIKDNLPDGIEVACHNSNENCTLTGPAEIVNKFVEKLQEEKIFARAVNVSNIAYHSRHIAPAAPNLLRRLSEVITEPAERSSKWISTSVPEDKWDTPSAKTCSAEYLTNNLVSPVLFEEGCRHIPENAVVIEIAPHGLLQAILKRSLHKTCTNISMTLRSSGSNSVGYLLSSIGKMYIAGCQPDVNAIFPKVDYPVSRGTPSTASLATWDHSESWENIGPTKDRPLSGEVFTVKLNEGSKFNLIRGHEIKNQKIIPSSLYMYFVWYMFATIRNEKMENQNIIFENIKVHRDLHVTLEKPRRLRLMIQYGSGDFEMLLTKKKDDEEPVVIMTGTIQVAYEIKPITTSPEDPSSRNEKKVHGREFYRHLENIGFKLDENFARITDMTYSGTECFGKIAWNDNWISFLDCLMKFHIYSDLDKNDLFFPVRIRRLEIHAPEFKSLRIGDEITCQKDLVTKKLRCGGMEMVGFVYAESTISTFLDADSSHLKMEAMHFISYSNPLLKNKETFLSFCLELAIESLILSTSHKNTKIRVVNTTEFMMEEIKKVIKERTELKSRVIFSNSVQDIDTENAALLISNDLCEFEKLQREIKRNPDDPLYALTISAVSKRNDSLVMLPDSVVEITKQSFDDVDIHLYRKLTEKQRYIPPVINASDDWVTKLLPKLKSTKADLIIAIRRNIEPADLDVICAAQTLPPNIRYLFIMDDDAPQFSTENPLYREQILRELPINILHTGHWGSYRSTSKYVKYTSQYLNDSKIDYHDFRMKNVELRYIAEIGEHDRIKNTVSRVYDVEYSGIDGSNKKIMGLGRATVNTPEYESDPSMTWIAPEYWSLEDACTVPLAYLQIDHILFSTDYKYTTSSPSIFVNSNDSFFKEACINTALHHNLKIFVTVSDGERTSFLRKFPALNKSNLLNRINYEYEIELKLSTKGEGVDVVINDHPSPEHLEATLNCTRRFGFYTFIGKTGTREAEAKIGMFMFLKNVTFKYMPNTSSFFLNLSPEVKVASHSRMECGIQKGVVRPLTCKVCKKFEPMKSSLVTFKEKRIHECIDFNDAEAPTKRINHVHFDERHSYILISNRRKIDLWFDLLQWLINRGARKFVISVDDQGIAPKYGDKINSLFSGAKGCSVTIIPTKIDTMEDAKNLIVEANKMQPLEAIFFVALDNGSTIFQTVDKVSRLYSPVHYISLFSGGLKECEHRKRQGLPAIVIHSGNRIDKFSSSVAMHMTRFFNQKRTPEDTCLYELIDKTSVEKNIQSNCLSQLLPNDLDTLERIGYRATDELQFREVVTRSRKYFVAKGTYPLFVIPGIDETFIRPLLQNLIYPAFCATFTEKCDSPLKSARELLRHIRKIQPDGPVTILGDTWGGPVAIELASLLQADKRRVKTFLVEGSPSTWQRRIRTLGQMNTSEFDFNLLETMLNIRVKDIVNMNHDWEDSLTQILNESQKRSIEKRNITKAINGIRRRLMSTTTYTQPQERLEHVVLFKQALLESCLEKYSLSNAVHLFEEDKYQDFLKNKDMAVSINKNASFSWWK